MIGETTELIGGPLDGMKIDVEYPLDFPSFHSVRLLCSSYAEGDSKEEIDKNSVVVIYRVREWKNGNKALVFDCYEN